ncbi:MAG: hypothetical protein AB7F59_09540 [Bdellovibrionales bacterium]
MEQLLLIRIQLMKTLLLLLVTLFSFKVLATDSLNEAQIYIQEYMTELRTDPATKMQTLPDIIKRDGSIYRRGQIRSFGDSQNFLRDISRTYIEFEPFFSVPGSEVEISNFFENTSINKNLFTMHTQQLNVGVPQTLPWGGSYWPTHKGLIAARYADAGFPGSREWDVNYHYVRDMPAENYIPDRVYALSPAEKYDLLIGNTTWTLPARMWKEGLAIFQALGYVATWQGICHGWAAAAHFSTPEPGHHVDVVSTTGIPIRFYKSDIKALASWLWAATSPPAQFIGSRCRIKNPARDENGRILAEECFDVNPGFWHLALAYRVGAEKRSLVIDSTFDAEVWNFPVTKFKTTYFNPESLRPSFHPTASVIPVERYTSDKFKKYRSSDTKYIVGIMMDVSHASIQSPGTTTNEEMIEKTVRYMYDLELNQNHEIIGGEWYTNGHPDFIWSYKAGSQAKTTSDLQLDPNIVWDGPAVPAPLAEAAFTESKKGLVLSRIVNELIKRSLQ